MPRTTSRHFDKRINRLLNNKRYRLEKSVYYDCAIKEQISLRASFEMTGTLKA